MIQSEQLFVNFCHEMVYKHTINNIFLLFFMVCLEGQRIPPFIYSRYSTEWYEEMLTSKQHRGFG